MTTCFYICAAAANAAEPPADETAPIEETKASRDKGGLLEWQRELVETQVQRGVEWVDSFFSDPDYMNEVASSQFRFRPEVYYRREQGAEPRAWVSLKLHLPNLSRRVSVVVGNSQDDANFGESVDDRVDESVIGLQFFGKMRRHWHTSLSTGLKFNEFAAYIGPRARYQKQFNNDTGLRFSQAVRWQTNNWWQIVSRLDVNHVLNDRYMFRQTLDGRWRGEESAEEGYRTRISSFVTRRLGPAAGLQYEFSTLIHTRPDTHVYSYTLAARYRKRTKRDWLYYEIVPQVSFENEFDYKANPGIRFRLEFFYGTDVEQRYWKREPEDTEDFRW